MWRRGLKFIAINATSFIKIVAARVAAWIEIRKGILQSVPFVVAARVAAWIEILKCMTLIMRLVVAARVAAWIEISCKIDKQPFCQVAARVAAWIEIAQINRRVLFDEVAARVAAWIEIQLRPLFSLSYRSPPVWRRGLKSLFIDQGVRADRRRPCGGVD